MLHSQRLSIHERLTSSCRSAQIFPQILLPAGRCSDFPKIMLPVPLRFSEDNSASWSVRIFQRRLCFLVCSDFPKKIMLPPPSLVVKIKSTRKERPVNAKSSSDETVRQGKYGGGEEHGFRRIREKTFFGSSSTLIFQERKTKDS